MDKKYYEFPIIETDDDRQLLYKVGDHLEVLWESNNEGYWNPYFTEEELFHLDWHFRVFQREVVDPEFCDGEPNE
ncbi:hypothetical protein [Enterococcus caccae]|uniref:Uncharacterized protein n=1 Tax=Enterococcus caccae ATCC BAA-1240 TaxID=1158612 RepID=R3WEA1_9ENTE|nr:hypothetical protein [Enterococcus caccae]EOL45787.1 hypothetical protein UC7_01584 [Enterococcus caccae ATCC BAA-1240]EOT60983.1 hypothetical protein I580_01885 [Enterococcus caccae ATCC BAA-1240]